MMIVNYFTRSKITILFLTAFILGTALADFFKLNWTVILAQTVLLTVLIVLLRKEKLILVFGVSALIILSSVTYRLFYQQKINPPTLPYGTETTLVGYVADWPDVRSDKIKITLKIQEPWPGAKILVTLPRFPEYQYGDQLKISGQILQPRSFEDFDYKKYLERYQIYAVSYNPKVEKIGQGKGNLISRVLFQLRARFEDTMAKILPEPHAALILGLTVGAKRGIPTDLSQAFIATSTTHIIVISGYNISVLIKIFYDALRVWSRRGSFWLTLLIISFFAILTGAEAPVVRASIMGTVFLLAKQVGRQEYAIISVLLASALMILQNPQILNFDRGFQLSFAAVLGLIYLSPLFEKWFSKWRKWEKIPKIFRETLTATLGAQIFTLPLLLFYFEKLSLVSLPANILILSVVPASMGLGFTAGILGMIFLPLGKIAALVPLIFSQWIIFWAQTLALVPKALVEVKFNFWFLLIAYLILGAVLVWYYRRVKKLKVKM